MNKPSNEHEAMTEESLALQRMNTAEDFPRNTCPASRIAAGLAEALITGQPYLLLTEEREYCGAIWPRPWRRCGRREPSWRGCRMRFGIIEWLWISLWITRLDRWRGAGVGCLYLEVS